MSLDLTKLPKLGFGMMRLPKKGEEIDFDHVCRMVDAYMAEGQYHYFDTSCVYNDGMSERVMGEAIAKRYPRDSFYFATKMPAWVWKEDGTQELDRIFNAQLERLQVDYFDFYLLHSIADSNYADYERRDSFHWAMQKKEEGKVRHFGFSFHGSPKLLSEILDKHPEVEFVQIQLNYADEKNQVVRSKELYDILLERNIPVIVMEPVKGGTLANVLPELEAKFRAARPEASPASWALRYVGSLEGVAVILSGMSSDEQMQDNLNTFRNFEPLTEGDREVLEDVRGIMLGMPQIPCTSCSYCTKGCPQGILIPDIFRAVNTNRLFPNDDRPKNNYAAFCKKGAPASDCLKCGQCESVCPQHLSIIEYLEEAVERFGK